MNDRLRAVALGNDPADLLLKNGRVVDVLTETVYEAEPLQTALLLPFCRQILLLLKRKK